MESPSQNEDSDEWGGADMVMEDPEEQRVLFAALDSFYQYAKVAHYNTTHLRRQSFYALPQSHWQFLASPPISYLDTLNAVDDAIDENGELATAILRNGLEFFGKSLELGDGKSKAFWRDTATSADVEKARSTIRQCYRDWSAEGAAERTACYGPIIRDLHNERATLEQNEPIRVLVPGAGLGRLVFELCHDGFNVEGNEISYHQLLASAYILNCCPRPREHTIYPWIHSFSNHQSRSAQLQSVEIPDVHPGAALRQGSQSGEMTMSASDFLLLYNNPSHNCIYDAVATCFFLDTAPNPIRYIETIWNCLKHGGIWTNLGPLLWHFENNPPGKHGNDGDGESTTMSDPGSSGIADPGSVELTDDEVMALVESFGFRVELREMGADAGYIQDPSSMLQSTYRVSHWVARKV